MVMRKLTVLFMISAALFLFSCQKGSQNGPSGAQEGGPGLALSPDVQINTLKDVVRQDPKNLKAWIELGDISMDAGRYQDAVTAFGAALKLDPRDVDVRVDMGTCFRSLGDPQKAIEEYKEALKINPKHANAKRNMGVVYAYDLHQNKEAEKMFQEYLKENPSAPDAADIRQEIAKLKENYR